MILLVIGVVAGWPSIHGGFLSGDDYHLIRDHVLVNHPSLEHAVKLFTIVHRDLYQPIPLLSFQIDFAIIRQLGLQPVTDGPQAGAWVFHLTNILLHAINGLCVFFVVARLSRDRTVGFVAALLFACHPLASEPIGWLNGRMMMLSTLFTLLSLVAFDRFGEKTTWWRAALTVLCVVAAHMSKVSLAIPFLLLVFPLMRRQMPGRGWWMLWAVVFAVTVGFGGYNVYTSEEMFDRAEGEMAGPPVVNVILALGQYFRHFVAPIGLSSWYPPPNNVGFGHPDFVAALVTVLLVGVIALACVRRTWVPILALIWFMAAVGPTLPFFPARRALAADRYVYLPNVGLCWLAGCAIVWIVGRWKPSATAAKRYAVAVGVVAAGCLMPGLWNALGFYRDNIAASDRIATCFPDEPGVYDASAWARYREGQYAEAIEVAQRELDQHYDVMAHKVFMVVGMSQYRLGRIDDAIDTLRAAVAHKPDYGKCYSRLAQVLAAAGQTEEAIVQYERAAEIMPFYNPGLLPLARLYRETGRLADARSTYEQVLRNNPYDVHAHLAMAELDLADDRNAKAADRLKELLGWMPENSVARTNLAVAFDRLGDTAAARNAYERAIVDAPNNMTAYVNLASLHQRTGDLQSAQRVYDIGLQKFMNDLTFQILYHDFAIAAGYPERSLAALNRVITSDSGWAAWRIYIQAQVCVANRASPCACTFPTDIGSFVSLLDLGRLLCALHQDDTTTVVTLTNRIVATDTHDPPDTFDRLLGDMERLSLASPDNPWPLYITTQVLRRQNRTELADLMMAEFDRLCRGEACSSRRAELGID